MAKGLTADARGGAKRGLPKKEPAPPAPADDTPPSAAAPGSNVTQEAFLKYFRELKVAKADVTARTADLASARGVVNGVYRRAKKIGINKHDLGRTLYLDSLDNDDRERELRVEHQNLEWIGKPIGTQASFNFAGAPAASDESQDTPEAMPEHRQFQITEAGRFAGSAGARADENPWPPGKYPHTLWAEGWMSGQEKKVHRELGEGAAGHV